MMKELRLVQQVKPINQRGTRRGGKERETGSRWPPPSTTQISLSQAAKGRCLKMKTSVESSELAGCWPIAKWAGRAEKEAVKRGTHDLWSGAAFACQRGSCGPCARKQEEEEPNTPPTDSLFSLCPSPSSYILRAGYLQDGIIRDLLVFPPHTRSSIFADGDDAEPSSPESMMQRQQPRDLLLLERTGGLFGSGGKLRTVVGKA